MIKMYTTVTTVISFIFEFINSFHPTVSLTITYSFSCVFAFNLINSLQSLPLLALPFLNQEVEAQKAIGSKAHHFGNRIAFSWEGLEIKCSLVSEVPDSTDRSSVSWFSFFICQAFLYLFCCAPQILLDKLKLPFRTKDVATKNIEDKVEKENKCFACIWLIKKLLWQNRWFIKKKWLSSPADIILIRRSEGTYQKRSDYNTNIYKTSCLPPLSNSLCQNLAAILFFKLKFVILKIKRCALSPPQTIRDILPYGEKWKFLAHQSDALIILAIVHFSADTFQSSTSNPCRIAKSLGVTSLIWFSSWLSQGETSNIFLSLWYNLDESISSVWSNLGLWSK